MRLNTLHNLHHYADLMRRARAAIEAGRYAEFLTNFRARAAEAEASAADGDKAHGRGGAAPAGAQRGTRGARGRAGSIAGEEIERYHHPPCPAPAPDDPPP